MASMMYTKGEFEVALTGGSPWGFTIRTQSGNGYNRGRVIVAKVVQGGKADSSGNIHVGDEILAVNGFEFDNEEQATEYVRIAKKELILRVKRGHDKRRMNIRLAGELPNYFATALESPYEKDIIYGNCNTSTSMFTDNDNNKRSSKEYEKDLCYKGGSDTANALIDYQNGQTADLNRAGSRLTRSTTDLSEYSGVTRDPHQQSHMSRRKLPSSVENVTQKMLNNSQRPRLQRQYTWNGQGSPPWKSYNAPASPDKVQRVRIRSTNVTSPDHYKYSSGSEKSSPSFDENKNSDSRSSPTPGYSPNSSKSFSSSVMQDLNRTWPSVGDQDASRQDVRLTTRHQSYSVSAVKSQFEQWSRSRMPEHDFSQEKEKRQKSSSPPWLPPKPPSRNSSFLSTRLSSSSSVFSDDGSSKMTTSASIPRHGSFSEKSPNRAYEKDSNVAPVRQGSSSEELDKPIPPRRFSHSKVLNSFRSNKKPVYQATVTGSSTVYERKDERSERSAEIVYHHGRTQSLPSAKITGQLPFSSKSWAIGKESEPFKGDEHSQNQRLPRSSSFSRARVLETSSVKTVHRDERRSPTFAGHSNITKNAPSVSEPHVIQALKTGEVSSKTTHEPNVELKSKSTPFLKQDTGSERRHDARTDVSVPMLKENSIMQRLLMESQGQNEPGVRSKAAAIKQEICKRSDGTTHTARPTNIIKSESGPPLQKQWSVNIVTTNKADEKPTIDRDLTSSQDASPVEDRKEMKMPVKDIKTEGQQIKIQDSRDVKQSAVKVDRYLDKLLVKLDSPPVKRRQLPTHVPDRIDPAPSVEDEVFHEPENIDNDNAVETETPPIENKSSEITAGSPLSDLTSLDNERNSKADPPSPEVMVKSDNVEVESCPPTFVKDNNDNISKNIVPDKVDLEANSRTKKIDELKDNCQPYRTLSPGETPLKAIHSRENSASSLLEETLESARTIASIYSVEGPTRSADGEDSLCTASEMRRYSLAKRVVRKKPKTGTASPVSKTTESVGEREQSFSTPEKIQSSFIDSGTPVDETEIDADDDNGNESPGSASSGSRPSSGIISPKLEVLEEQKELLISSMKKKIELLKEQESEINGEMKQNDNLGKRVAEDVKSKTSGTEYSKFELFVGELNNIIGLLLSLTQRMHRYEVMLQDIDLAEDNGREKRDNLLKRIDRVKQQYEEACTIKEINDKRGETVAKFVQEYCSDEEFADFQHFVDMKTQLALTQAEIKDKIKLGEEKLNALTSANIDWSSFDLNSK